MIFVLFSICNDNWLISEMIIHKKHSSVEKQALDMQMFSYIKRNYFEYSPQTQVVLLVFTARLQYQKVINDIFKNTPHNKLWLICFMNLALSCLYTVSQCATTIYA